MDSSAAGLQVVHRTARIRLRVTRHQAQRCYGLLRSAGDLWAWLLDTNRRRLQHGLAPIVGYQALCRELTARGPIGELSTVGARSILRRYSDAWFEAASRRRHGKRAGFPRRKRRLVPIRFCHGTFQLEGQRVRLPVARGGPALWVRLARPVPYSIDDVRAITLLADGGRLWVAVTAAVPLHQNELDRGRVAGVDPGIIHPYAVVTDQAALLVSGRAIRAESFLHLHDQQARQAKAAHRAPKPGQRGSRRWRRHRASYAGPRPVIVAASIRPSMKPQSRWSRSQFGRKSGALLVGDPEHITSRDVGRVQNLRLRQWRRTHLVQALRDKAERAGIQVRMVNERGTSSTCPACQRKTPKPSGRRIHCPHCNLTWHRDLVGATNIAAKHGGGPTGPAENVPVEHRRAGMVPARRDRRRHQHDLRRSCLATGHPQEHQGSFGCRSPHATTNPASGEDQATKPNRANVA